MYLANKLRRYVRTNSTTREAVEKKDKVDAKGAQEIFREVFGLDVDTSKFKYGWDGSNQAKKFQGKMPDYTSL